MTNTASIFSRPSSPAKPQQAAASYPRIKVNGPDKKHIMLPLMPGEEGKRQFELEVRKFLHLGPEAKININFDVKAPASLHLSNGGSYSSFSSSQPAPASEIVRLAGLKTYDAAFHCASLAAEERRTSFTHGNINAMQKAPSASSLSRQSAGNNSQGGGGGSNGGNDLGRSRKLDQIQTKSKSLPPKPQAAAAAAKAGKVKSGGEGWMSKMIDLVTFKGSKDQTKVWIYQQSPQTF